MKINRFEELLASHCAPVLLGIKPANLISVGKDVADIHKEVERFNKKAAAKRLRMKIMCECGKKALVLVYNERLMEKQLHEQERLDILQSCGYDGYCTDELLDELAQRLSQGGDFPHEIGVFLGYPVHDVVGFMEKQSFVFSGYWKVYDDEERARRVFANYTKCRRFLCGKLSDGVGIYEAIKIS